MDELKKFYNANYSSNMMNLVLVGRHSLDELQNLAVDNFSGVENKHLPRKDFKDEVVFDEKHSFGKIFKIIPTKKIQTLSLRWIMPVSTLDCKKKSAQYLSHVFGHEGPNSLMSQLVKDALATGLTAGSSSRLNQSFDIFTVTISLTDKGEKDYQRVMELVYMYINQIRNLGPQEYIYKEI